MNSKLIKDDMFGGGSSPFIYSLEIFARLWVEYKSQKGGGETEVYKGRMFGPMLPVLFLSG